MRRYLYALVLVALLLLVLSLTGCADLAQLFPEPEEEELGSVFVPPTPEQTFSPTTSTAARILSRGKMVVGVRYDLEPLSYVTSDSQLAGLEIDLARELARRWLGSADAVEFRQVRSDTAYQYLSDGAVDVVLAGLIHTREDEARADFGPSYFADGMALLTFPDAGIQGLGDIGGKPVGTVNWTDSQEALTAATPVTPTHKMYDHYFDVLEALRAREIEAYADQRHRLERARRAVNGTTIVGQWTWAPVAMIYRQDDPFFANVVRLTFQDMATDGTRDSLYERWLPGTSPPSIGFLSGTVPTPELSQSPQQLSDLDVLARIRDRGALAVGYYQNLWPYSGDRADGVPTGFEIRLLERVAELWLGTSDAINFVPVLDEADALQRLERGEVDILAGNWVHTREAELRVDFSIPILDDGVSILSLAASPVADLQALSGQPVGVVAGSSAEAAVPSLSQGVGLSAVGYASLEEALAGLQAGEVVAILSARRPALDVHFRQSGYAFTDQRYTYRPVAYVLPEGDSDFRDLVNLTLMLLEDRGIYQELYELWFDDPTSELTSWPGTSGISLVIRP
ncbi:MAG: transporter substrate-binding domain-containing protein [Anaerolineae bacterium]